MILTNEERKEIISEAVTLFGVPAQTDMAIEEMAELTKELLKIRRVKAPMGAPEYRAALAKVIEEMADVQVMLDQLKIMYGPCEEMEKFKIKRLAVKTLIERGKTSASAEDLFAAHPELAARAHAEYEAYTQNMRGAAEGMIKNFATMLNKTEAEK